MRRELYFWSFVVALLIFALGAGVSAYEGIQRLSDPQAIENPLVIYIVLAASLLFEGGSWIVGTRAFRQTQAHLGWWDAFRQSKDPPAFIVVFEDSAAVLGLLVAAPAPPRPSSPGTAAGTASLPWCRRNPGRCLRCCGARVEALLIGERADPKLSDAIIRMAAGVAGVCKANSIATVQLAPKNIVAYLSIDFFDYLRAPDIDMPCSSWKEDPRRLPGSLRAVR